MIEQLIKEGFALKNRGYYKKAIEVFYKAIEKDSQSLELLLEVADLYYLLQDNERALEYLEQILDKNPTHIDALKLLKKIFIDKKAYLEAEQTAKNIYCISHSSDDLLEILKILNIQGKYDEIFEYKIEQQTPQISLELARAYFSKRDYENAKICVDKYLEEEPASSVGILLLGQICLAQNKKEECIEILNRMENFERTPELLNFIGLIEMYRENYQKSIKSFLDAIKMEQKGIYYYNLANVYFKLGEGSYAKKYYNLAISIEPENKNFHFALANLYYREKHYKRALEELSDDFFEARLLKSIILYDTGYLALARQELDLLSKEAPENEIIKDYQQRINLELGLN